MKASVWMTAAAIGAWIAIGLVAGVELIDDIGLGIAGPLVAAVATRLVVEHTAATNRALLHQRLLQGFAVKAVFFAVYVVVMLRGLQLQPLPFVVSFTSAFLVLHVTEAILLQRLTARHTPSIAS
jgi:hypothetical protein